MVHDRELFEEQIGWSMCQHILWMWQYIIQVYFKNLILGKYSDTFSWNMYGALDMPIGSLHFSYFIQVSILVQILLASGVSLIC